MAERSINAALVAAVRDGLANAEDWFRDYERRHLAKGTPEGREKAEANRRRADECHERLAYVDRLAAALEALEREAGGWVRVPREPRFRQVVAGREALGRLPSERAYGLVEEIYGAMIAATPPPPPPSKGEGR